MNARLVTREAAERDIRDIVTYIATDSPQAAERFRVEIWNAFRLITEQPDIGRAHSEFAVPLRSIRVSSRFRKYLVFYRRIGQETVEVVRVLHGARDIASLFENIP
ncbi:MAG TPA: type II toxin-antitoxin system RelE/ParE family toxin [Rhizomicrobium sp.]|jgi:toxin ParE1/3/4